MISHCGFDLFISLMASDVQHFFLKLLYCHLYIGHLSFLRKYLFKVFVHFLIGFHFFFPSFFAIQLFEFHIFSGYQCFGSYLFTNIFSLIVEFFCLLIGTLAVQKFFKESLFVYFFLCSWYFWSLMQKI